ncbi:MAG: ribosomal RNA small subunit methyltransferase A [Candidatus Aegiribacteria sp.]|nr:ribosomal RNA small subunit methyltransferase A [Candidatus Aegiribacteria sp.]MBD3294396.1 ribosomal RNA small subunit methyltransferase A [Candidatus Fermentibacteria bacterium]
MMLAGELKGKLREIGLKPQRNLGQNFLVSPHIARRIAAQLPQEGNVLEIGPGMGSLTVFLAKRCQSVTAVEISGRMVEFLRREMEFSNLHFVKGDFMNADPRELPGYPFAAVAGNLPYSISSPALFRMLEEGFRSVDRAVLMLQREVARRLCALDGGGDYGKLSLQVWPIFKTKALLDAGPDDFYPAPRVRSRVVIMDRRPEPLVKPENFAVYRKMVRVSFAARRKTILNNLKPLLGRDRAVEVLRDCGIDPGCRAEQLEPEKFVHLAKAMA